MSSYLVSSALGAGPIGGHDSVSGIALGRWQQTGGVEMEMRVLLAILAMATSDAHGVEVPAAPTQLGMAVGVEPEITAKMVDAVMKLAREDRHFNPMLWSRHGPIVGVLNEDLTKPWVDRLRGSELPARCRSFGISTEDFKRVSDATFQYVISIRQGVAGQLVLDPEKITSDEVMRQSLKNFENIQGLTPEQQREIQEKLEAEFKKMPRQPGQDKMAFPDAATRERTRLIQELVKSLAIRTDLTVATGDSVDLLSSPELEDRRWGAQELASQVSNLQALHKSGEIIGVKGERWPYAKIETELLAGLRGDDSEVKYNCAASFALVGPGKPEAVPLLLKELEAAPMPRYERNHIPASDTANSDIDNARRAAVGLSGLDCVKELAEWLSAESLAQRAWACEIIGMKDTVPLPLIPAVLLATNADHPAEVRVARLHAIERMSDVPPQGQKLVEESLESTNENEQLAAAYVFGRAVIPVSSRSAARLIELANSPLAEDELSEAVAKAIHDRGGCTGVGVTVDKWSGLEIRLKRLLILSLGHQCQTCDPELKARLRKLIELEMRSPDQELRDQAIIEIADLASDAPAVQPVVGPVPFMVQKILDKAMNSQDDDDIELVNREVKELREEERARLVQELRPLIRGKVVEKRARALILLGMTGASAKPAVGDLVEVLSSENDAEVLNNVCNTLTMIGPPAAPALDTLQRLAERYPDVKHAAELAIVSIKRKP